MNHLSLKLRRKLRATSALIVLGAISAVFGHGCGQFKSNSFNSNSELTEDVVGETMDDLEIIPGALTVSTVYAKQILDNMASCTGAARPSDQTLQEYEDRKGSLSEYGFALHITAPMMMGIVGLAGEVCNDLISSEQRQPASQRRIFTTFNFESDQFGTQDLDDAIERLALSCWQRNTDSTEKTILRDSILEAVNGDSAKARKAAIMACTATLSSLSAIEL